MIGRPSSSNSFVYGLQRKNGFGRHEFAHRGIVKYCNTYVGKFHSIVTNTGKYTFCNVRDLSHLSKSFS